MDHIGIERMAGLFPEVTILRLTGPFTLSTMNPFQSLLREPDLKHVIIDLSRVPYIDSAALGVLLGHWADCLRNGTRMALAGASQRVKTIFEITHTDTMLAFFATADDADNSFAKSSPE